MYRRYLHGTQPLTRSAQQFEGVVDPHVARVASKSFSNIIPRLSIDRNDRRHYLYEGPRGLYNVVQFNSKHEPQALREMFEWSDEALTVLDVALTRFGLALKLEGQHEVGVSFVQTNISSIGTGNFSWRCDGNAEASWTMCTLLDDPDHPETGWTGGELSRSTYYFSRDPVAIAQPVSSIETFQPKFCGSILYHNFNTLVRVGEMNPRKEDTRTTSMELRLYLRDTNIKGIFEGTYLKEGDQIEMKVNLLNGDHI